METTIKEIRKAYNNVIANNSYKSKKHLADAIYIELFLSGAEGIPELIINAFIDSLDLSKDEKEINKSNRACATIGNTKFAVCLTEDNHLYICKRDDYLQDFKKNIFTVKKSVLEIKDDKDKLFALLNSTDLFNEVLNYNENKEYFRHFSKKQIQKALSIYIFLTSN